MEFDKVIDNIIISIEKENKLIYGKNQSIKVDFEESIQQKETTEDSQWFCYMRSICSITYCTHEGLRSESKRVSRLFVTLDCAYRLIFR